jgi:HAD superfamily hydrolase (TIGR01509 family)
MSRPPFDLLIFDFDGVVADSERLANQLLAEYLTGLGRPTTLEESMREFMGRRAEDVAAAAERWLGGAPRPTFTEDYRAYSRDRMRTEVGPVSGVGGFLEAHAHLARCVASSSSPPWLDHCVDKFGFRPHFGANLFSATLVANGKPAPDIFLFAASAMQVRPERTLVIEDSPAGVQGARAAGMTVVGFLGGSHIRDGDQARLEAAGAHHLAADYAALTRWLATGTPPAVTR